jgi:putative peptidoglycan lipid II flippase
MNKSQKIMGAALVVMLATFLSRLLGLGRLMVITHQFGSGIETDAFWAAFTLPNMLRELLAEGALSLAFIPVFVQYLSKTDKEEAWRLASIVFNLLVVTLLVVVSLGILGAKWYVPLFFPGFQQSPSKLELAVQLTQFTFPFIALMAFASLAMGILHSKKHFSSPAFAPVIFNILVISSILLLSKKYGIYSLPLGVLLGGLGQLLFQLPSLSKRGWKYYFNFNYNHPGVKKILKFLLPVGLLALITQVRASLIPRFFASFLGDGILSDLQWAMLLIRFPLGIFPIAIATVIFPTLSQEALNKESQELKNTLSLGLRMAFFLTIPASLGLIILKTPIIRLLLEHGKFTTLHSEMTAQALAYYALGLFAMGGTVILIRVFYSLQDMKTPLKVGALVTLFSILLSWWLFELLKHRGLALAVSLSAIANMGVLLFILKRRLGNLDGRRIAKSSLKVIIASAFMGMVCLLVSQRLEGINLFLQVFSSILAGLITLITLSCLLRIEEIKLVWGVIRKKR